MKELSFKFMIDEINLILEALGKEPFTKVNDLVVKIQQQGQEQIETSKIPQNGTEEPETVKEKQDG